MKKKKLDNLDVPESKGQPIRAYFDSELQPASKDQASIVKIIHHDGRITFGHIERKEADET